MMPSLLNPQRRTGHETMKRTIPSILLVAVFFLGGVKAHLDSFLLYPQNDAFTRITDTNANFDANGLSAVSSTSACNQTDRIYIQWDLSSVPDGTTIDVASITLTAEFVSKSAGATLGLYKTQDSWVETGITQNNAPAVGNLLASVSAPSSAGQSIVYNGAALLAYLNQEAAGDDIASFAVQFNDDCAEGISLAVFSDAEAGSGRPVLQIEYTFTPTPTVTIGPSPTPTLTATPGPSPTPTQEVSNPLLYLPILLRDYSN